MCFYDSLSCFYLLYFFFTKLSFRVLYNTVYYIYESCDHQNNNKTSYKSFLWWRFLYIQNYGKKASYFFVCAKIEYMHQIFYYFFRICKKKDDKFYWSRKGSFNIVKTRRFINFQESLPLTSWVGIKKLSCIRYVFLFI